MQLRSVKKSAWNYVLVFAVYGDLCHVISKLTVIALRELKNVNETSAKSSLWQCMEKDTVCVDLELFLVDLCLDWSVLQGFKNLRC
jgi:hypothetical protein